MAQPIEEFTNLVERISESTARVAAGAGVNLAIPGGDTLPPTVAVITPNGGEILQGNQQFVIQWQSSDNVGLVAHDVKFSRDGGTSFTDIATNLPGSAQSFTWTVPSQPTSQGIIRVVARDAAGNQAGDRSDAVFSIQAMIDTIPPTVTVTSPNGGEILQPNQQFLIQWQSSDNVAVVAHDVKFSRDGGSTFTDIITNLSGSTKSFLWMVPSQSTSQGVIRVVARDAAGNQGGDRSDAVFSIQAMIDTIPPTVTVTSPNGGEILQPNQQFLIQWQSGDNVAVVAHDVKFSRDGGSTFTDIITNLSGSTKSFLWMVPSQSTSQGVIRVVARDAAGNQGGDRSDAVFSIQAMIDTIPPTVTVTSPNGGEILQPNQQFLIQWQSGDNVAVVAHDVRFSRDGGATFTDIITNLSGSTKSFLWMVPSQSTSQGVIRVVARDAAGNQGADSSNAPFSIQAMIDTIPPTVTVTSPNGGETLQPGQQFLIQWQSGDNVGVVAHDVKFSRDGGATFTDIATNLSGSAQTFTWTVPSQGTNQGLIRVVARDAAGNQGADSSNAPFSIQAMMDTIPPTVRVIAPNGGERLQGGRQFLITWQSSDNVGVVSHDLLLSINGGATFPIDIARGLPGNSQSFMWTIPNIRTNQAKLRIIARDASGNQQVDDSDGVFAIGEIIPGATPFQFVLSFGSVRPAIVLLNTNSTSKLPVRINPAAPPPNVTVDDSSGTISFFVDEAGPWFIQSGYEGNGSDIIGYMVTTPPLTIAPDQPLSVNIARTAASHSITFRPVDFQGQPITPSFNDGRSRLLCSFVHRATGNSFGKPFDSGFTQGIRLLVSDVTPDYTFSAVGAFGRLLPQPGRPLHLYLYSYRNGIRSDLDLSNSAAQLARREIVGYPNVNTDAVYFTTGFGFIAYSPEAGLPQRQFGVETAAIDTMLVPGQPGSIYVLDSSDMPLNLTDPATARMPDFPVFFLFLGTSNSNGNAFANNLFVSPLFAVSGNQTLAFLGVDTARARFDRVDLPASGQLPIGAGPLFDTTVWLRNSQTKNLELRSSHFIAASGVYGYVTHLTADGSSQGRVTTFAQGAIPTYKLRFPSGKSINGTLDFVRADPVFLTMSDAPPGDYRFTLQHPGTNIAGRLFPALTKSTFKVGPTLDTSPPALTKLQLLANGRLVNAIDPVATQNVLLFNIDPVSQTGGTDALQAVTLAVSKDGNAFVRVQLTRLANGDWQATLPAPGNAARFDFKITATDLASNRLVSRFSAAVGVNRGPGPALALDTAFEANPANLGFSLALGGTAPGQILSVGSADEPIDFTVQSDAPWLRVSPAAGTTPSALSVSVDGRGLPAGVYQGRLTITADDSSTASPVAVPVTLNVTGRRIPAIVIRPGDEPPINGTL